MTVYSANMDANPGWTTSGQWAWGTPTGSSGDPAGGFTGTKVYGYNLNGAYANNISTTYWLRTSAIDCSGYTGIHLKFYRWLGVGGSYYDHAYVSVSNNGSTWTSIWSNGVGPISDGGWFLQEFDISTYADDQATVYIRWGLGPTDSSVTYCGWNIDDVVVTAEASGATVVSITPNEGGNTGSVSITDLAGTGFEPGAAVKLRRSGLADVIATDVDVVSENQITCTLDLSGVVTGWWEVLVENPGGGFGGLPRGFLVTGAAKLVFVAPGGDDANSGLSWATAKGSVQGGMDAAAGGDEVWVAAGTFVERITVVAGVGLYGGFAGVETQRSERPAFPRPTPDPNETILDGNQGGSVMTVPAGADTSTVIDGFTVRNGKAMWGGGIYCYYASPTIRNNRITGNSAEASGFGVAWTGGGGIHCGESSAVIVDNVIEDNQSVGAYSVAYSKGYGGGIYCSGWESSATISRNTIRRNKAGGQAGAMGGGICSQGNSPVISYNVITDNTAVQYNDAYGGGIYSSGGSVTVLNNVISGNTASSSEVYGSHDDGGGGIYGYSSVLLVANNVITGNSSVTDGGGIYCRSCSGSVANNTIVANACGVDGGGIYHYWSAPVTVSNNIIAFNSSGIGVEGYDPAVLRHNCVYGNGDYGYSGVSGGTGDITADPQFANVSGGNVHLAPGSPCRDAGDDGSASGAWVDMDGQARIEGPHVDIGADESYGEVWNITPVIVRVRSDGDDGNDGSSWLLAKRTVQAAIEAAALQGGEVWVKAGTYEGGVALRQYVHLYGGFSGSETDRGQRDRASNETILDGQQVGDVITATRLAWGTSTIDGFTIRNGKAGSGWGIRCSYSSPVIANNAISSNAGGIRGEYSLAWITGNTISGNAGRGIYFRDFSSAVISENAIRGNSGGGVQCDDGAGRIVDNDISGNTASSGGGVSCYNSSAMVSGNVITGNTATSGGGIAFSSLEVNIANNRIEGNVSSGGNNGGGGIYCTWCDYGTISGNTIRGNQGSGIYVSYGGPVISNNTIAGNSGTAVYCADSNSSPEVVNNRIAGNAETGVRCLGSGAVRNNTIVANGYCGVECGDTITVRNNIMAFNLYGACRYDAGNPTLGNNCVYGNAASDYFGLLPGAGDISVDPRLASVVLGDVHIQADSPCRDAGDDSAVGWDEVDLDGQARIEGAHVDIGADESYGESWSVTPTIVRVSPGGDDANDGSTWGLAKRSVGAGVSAASVAGGEVWVAAGTYNERIVLPPYASVYGGFAGGETERSQRDATVNVTILDGQQGGSVVAIQSGRSENCIDGFTIRNGRATEGGGIRCIGSTPVIAHNTITGNAATWWGCGIFCESSEATIVYNTITGNEGADDQLYGGGIACSYSADAISNNTIAQNSRVDYGGGIYCWHASPTITHNAISGNESRSNGAGVCCEYESAAVISNNVIAGNISVYWGDGGGVFCSGSPAVVTNNTIVENEAGRGGGVYLSYSTAAISNNIVAFNNSGVYRYSDAQVPTLRNNDVYNPGGANYTGLGAGVGDISADPVFVDRAGGDYHLGAGSPCINTGWGSAPGMTVSDMDGESRVLRGRVDIGADEVPGANLADLDNDGDVDLADFSEFQGCFNGPNRPLKEGCGAAADLDHDSDVDLVDFSVFQGCFNGPNRTPRCL